MNCVRIAYLKGRKNTLNLQANCISKSLPENLSNFIRLACSPCWTSASKSCDNNRTHRLPEIKDTITLQSVIIIIAYRINYVSKLHKCTDKVDSSQIQLNKLNVLNDDFLYNMLSNCCLDSVLQLCICIMTVNLNNTNEKIIKTWTINMFNGVYK